MAATSAPEDEIAPIRFVEVCPECGYSLAGSPEEGRCPECGAAYDQSVLILHGAARGKRATIENVSLSKMWRPLIQPIAWVCVAILPFLFGGALDRGHVLVGAAWMLILAFSLFARWNRSELGLIVIYLSPARCLQIDNQQTMVIHRAFLPSIILLILFGLLGVALSQDTEFETRIKQLALLGGGILISGYFIARAFRAPAGVEPRRTPQQLLKNGGHRWQGNDQLSFEAIDPNRGHLKIYTAAGVEIIDAEVRCDESRRFAIERLIAGWIRSYSPHPSQPANPS